MNWLAEHGARLAAGATLVLAGGCGVVWLTRGPVEQRRLGVLTALALVVYAVVAIVPLPRWTWSHAAMATPAVVAPAAESPAARAPMDPPLMSAAVPAPAADREIGVRAPDVAPVPGIPIATAIAWPTCGEVLAWVFVVGAFGCALWLLLGVVRLQGLLRASRGAPPWLAEAAVARVRITDRATRPFCAGVWRPVVVLPRDLATPARAGAAHAVLAHELAHLRAGDQRVQALFAALLPLLWWQPLFWWLRARVRFASELLADDAAARVSTVPGYARELLAAVAFDQPSVGHAAALSVFHRPSEFYRRIEMLLRREGPLSRSVPWHRRAGSALGALVLVTAAAATCGVARAQEPAEVASLRAEIARLKEVVASLEAEVARLQGQPGAAPPGEAGAEAPPSPSPSPSLARLLESRDYTVQVGDTLENIARRFTGKAGNAAAILELNPGLDAARLRVGQTIKVMLRAGGDRGKAEARVHELLQERGFQQASQASTPPPPVDGGESLGWTRGVRAQMDVITHFLELKGAVEVAEAEFEALKERADKGTEDARSVRVALIKLKTLQRQFDVSRELLRGDLDNAKHDIQTRQSLFNAGRMSAAEARLGELENYIRALEHVL